MLAPPCVTRFHSPKPYPWPWAAAVAAVKPSAARATASRGRTILMDMCFPPDAPPTSSYVISPNPIPQAKPSPPAEAGSADRAIAFLDDREHLVGIALP